MLRGYLGIGIRKVLDQHVDSLQQLLRELATVGTGLQIRTWGYRFVFILGCPAPPRTIPGSVSRVAEAAVWKVARPIMQITPGQARWGGPACVDQ